MQLLDLRSEDGAIDFQIKGTRYVVSAVNNKMHVLLSAETPWLFNFLLLRI